MKTTLKRVAAIGVVVLLAGCNTTPTRHSATEYQVQRVDYDSTTDLQAALQVHLNTMSKDGWQLVHVVDTGNKFRVVMSRPKR